MTHKPMTHLSEFDETERVEARIGRVFYDGQHPDYGHVTTLMLLIPVFEEKGLRGSCYMQVSMPPDQFKVGHRVVFEGSKGWLKYPNGKLRALNRIGTTKAEYTQPGKIFAGG